MNYFTAPCGLDLVLLLDTSSSVGNYLQRVKNFAISIVTSLYANAYSTRVGLVTFSTNAQNRFFLGSFQNLAEITQAIQSVTISVGQLPLSVQTLEIISITATV